MSKIKFILAKNREQYDKFIADYGLQGIFLQSAEQLQALDKTILYVITGYYSEKTLEALEWAYANPERCIIFDVTKGRGV